MAEETTNSEPIETTAETVVADPVIEATGEEATALGSPIADAPEVALETKAPEKYEFAVEGMELDAAMLAEAEPIFRDLNLSNEEAGRFMPVAAKFAEKVSADTINELVSQGQAKRKSWLDEAKADKELGGGNWEKTLHVAAKGLDTIGYTKGHPFRQLLEETGFGNNVHMIRMARTLGELVSEDGTFARSDVAPTGTGEASNRWYNKQGAE